LTFQDRRGKGLPFPRRFFCEKKKEKQMNEGTVFAAVQGVESNRIKSVRLRADGQRDSHVFFHRGVTAAEVFEICKAALLEEAAARRKAQLAVENDAMHGV